MLKVGLLGMVAMHAIVGHWLHVHGRVVGASDQTSEIIEMRGPGGAPPTWCAATTGLRPSCSPERMRPWSTRRTASPPEGDRLAPFGSPAGVFDPQAEHRWDT